MAIRNPKTLYIVTLGPFQVVITDFGLSKVVPDAALLKTLWDSKVYGTGGVPRYQ